MVDPEGYGNPLWRKDAEAATEEARRRIALAAESDDPELYETLDLTDLIAMTALPEEIATLSRLKQLCVGDRRPDGSLAAHHYDRRELRDLSPLSGLAGLTLLSFDGTPVSDLSPLSGLAGLTSLSFGGTQVSDLSPLSGLAGLTSLSFGGTQVSDLSPLSGLAGLTSLRFGDTQVSDLSPLSGLAGLTSLSFDRTQVSDLSPLSGLAGLTSLSFDGTPVSDLSPLSGLAGLTSLRFDGTQVSDLSPLSGLAGLTSLRFGGTQVSDLSPLLDLPEFYHERARYLSYSNTPAAKPDTDRRLDMLSRVPRARCAIETMQYLKGTHPDFRDPPAAVLSAPGLASDLSKAATIALTERDGALAVANIGKPQRLKPEERSLRFKAIQAHVDQVIAAAERYNVPREVQADLAAYRAHLVDEDLVFLLLDGPMSFLRGGLSEDMISGGLNARFVAPWQTLIEMHDALRPHYLPEAAEDAVPEPQPEATPEAGLVLADQVSEAFDDPSVADDLREVVDLAKDFLRGAQQARSEAERKSWLKRGLSVLGAVVSQPLGFAATFVTITSWVASPQGQAVIAKLGPVWAAIRAFFGV